MSRAYACFTSFEVPEDINLPTWTELPDGVTYLVWQVEACPKTGHLHLQGYAEFPNKIRWANAGKRLGIRAAHWENRKGNQTQAVEYCKKPERKAGWWELGTPVSGGQGARNDMKDIYLMCKEGKSMAEIAESHTSQVIRYSRGIEKLKLILQKNEIIDRNVTVLVGAPDAGKSHAAYELLGIEAFFKPDGSLWWDGYDGQESVIINDYAGEFPISYLLNLLDKWPMKVQTKGGYVTWKARRIIITANDHPLTWYEGKLTPAREGALVRRLKIVKIDDRETQKEFLEQDREVSQLLKELYAT